TFALTLADATGAAVAAVESLVLRAVPRSGLAGAAQGGGEHLYAVEWTALPASAPTGAASVLEVRDGVLPDPGALDGVAALVLRTPAPGGADDDPVRAAHRT
ncbi:hypothetical protein JHN49_46460, partial [Streptomyces sp. MBT57]|nr:hypothetical protein [Streptomyces sp. MBT57]